MTKQEFESFASGDEHALSGFFKAHFGYTTGWLIYRESCPKDRAPDIYCDAVLRIRDKAMSGDLEYGNIRAYLLKTAINFWKMEQRGETSLLKQQENYLNQISDTGIESEFDLLEKVETEEQLETQRKRNLVLVSNAMQKLSEACRILLKDNIINGIKVGKLVEKYGLKNAKGVTAKKQDCMSQFRNHIKIMAIDKGWNLNM